MGIIAKIRKFFYLTPCDAGMQIYSVEEIAEIMNSKTPVKEYDSLVGFGKIVRYVFEE